MIPVYEPLFQGNEKKYLQQCIDSGWVSSEGYFVQKFEEEFAKWSGNKYAIAVCNGTAALEIAIWATTIKQICIPNSTIISCFLAPYRLQLNILFYQNYLVQNNYIGYHILRCHLFGHYNNSQASGIIIDDASQYWKPFKVKDVACYSLYANKLICAGEGGVIVTNKKEIYERARSYRNLCHSKERFVHNDIGYNFRMSNLQGAVALAQLEQIDKFIEIKQKNRDLYKKYLPNNITILFDVEIPWMYLISIPHKAKIITQKLYKKNIDTRRFFYPLSSHKFCYSFHNPPNELYIGKIFWEDLFYLPSGLTLTEKQIGYICKILKDIL